MNRVRIALTIHLAVAALAAAAGEAANPPWDQCPEPYREGIMSGVDKYVANADASPQAAHEEWVAARQAEGWTYGEKKDADLKTHPLILPWDQLPLLQRAKDFVFKAIVDALKDVPDAATAAEKAAGTPPPSVIMATPSGYVPIKYVGIRAFYIDGAYGTKLRFDRGQTRMVPADKARLMLNHPDTYVMGELQREAPTEPAPQLGVGKPQDKEEDRAQEARDVIVLMDKPALIAYASQHFQQDLDKRRSVDSLRAAVTRLVDQYGAPEA